MVSGSPPCGEELPTWSERLVVVFATLLFGEGQEEFSVCLCTCESWREKGIRISCTYIQGFPLLQPLRYVERFNSLLTSFNLDTVVSYLRTD